MRYFYCLFAGSFLLLPGLGCASAEGAGGEGRGAPLGELEARCDPRVLGEQIVPDDCGVFVISRNIPPSSFEKRDGSAAYPYSRDQLDEVLKKSKGCLDGT